MRMIFTKRFMIFFIKRAFALLEATMLLDRLSSLLKKATQKSKP
jgi:hypothetical protein